MSLIRALRDRFFGRDWNNGPSQIWQTRFSGIHILIDSIDGLRQRARGFGQQTFRLDQHRFMPALTTRFHVRRRRRPRLRRSFPVQTSADERGDRRSFGTHHPPFSGASAHSLTTWIVAFLGVSRLRVALIGCLELHLRDQQPWLSGINGLRQARRWRPLYGEIEGSEDLI